MAGSNFIFIDANSYENLESLKVNDYDMPVFFINEKEDIFSFA